MKTSYKILTGLLLSLALIGCKDSAVNADPAAPETNRIQAYIHANTSDITIKPADGNNVSITWGEGTYISSEKVFPIIIGRRVTNVVDSLPLSIELDETSFLCKDTCVFAAGQVFDTVWVATALEFGQSDKIAISIPDAFSTAYGTKSIEINVAVDYTWLPAGSVTMTSQWEGTTGTVSIEKAKEFTNAAGDSLYRLNSPYYHLAPDYCTKEGFHLCFTLDKDYNAVDLFGGTWIQVENTGYNWIYWNTKKYGAYNYFVNSTNEYVISCLWSDGSGLYGPYIESFVWDKGFPGQLVNPSEGDSELDNIVFTSASYEIALDKYGDPVTVDEILDPVKYAADKYVFPESYIGHYLYYVTLSGANGTMMLELTGDDITGKYSFASYTVDGDNLIGTAGMAQPGKWNGSSNEGCYLTTALSKYYLTGGKITITDTQTTIHVTSANGTEISASYAGKITEASAPGRNAKRLFTK